MQISHIDHILIQYLRLEYRIVATKEMWPQSCMQRNYYHRALETKNLDLQTLSARGRRLVAGGHLLYTRKRLQNLENLRVYLNYFPILHVY